MFYSWSASSGETGVQADISDMVPVQQPRHETLQSQSITSVMAGTILSLRKENSNRIVKGVAVTSLAMFQAICLIIASCCDITRRVAQRRNNFWAYGS